MITDLFGTSPAISTSATAPQHRTRRAASLGIVTFAAIGLFVGGMGATASAAPGLQDGDSTTANVAVTEGITLTALTADFTLTGAPGATVFGIGAVTMNVETNNVAGYNVTVQSDDATLDPADPVGNTDTIPIDALTVRETGTSDYAAMAAIATPVHAQPGRSADGGDIVSNDFQIRIPVVNADTYSATLNYVATTL